MLNPCSTNDDSLGQLINWGNDHCVYPMFDVNGMNYHHNQLVTDMIDANSMIDLNVDQFGIIG